MLADFLGKGWPFPVFDQESSIPARIGEDSIRDAIWIILATAPGERVMRPDFGCGVHDLVFAVNDSTTLGRVERQVYDALVRWEPRIEVLGVTAEEKGRGEVLLINIHYRVRSTNNFFNLVYPFYLTVGAQ
ncbi:MAG TPA: GPW/gp25 family protein [Terriglobales bacterium]|nr:GPW/gp25 family protein [Terriglobales bacterium]